MPFRLFIISSRIPFIFFYLYKGLPAWMLPLICQTKRNTGIDRHFTLYKWHFSQKKFSHFHRKLAHYGKSGSEKFQKLFNGADTLWRLRFTFSR